MGAKRDTLFTAAAFGMFIATGGIAANAETSPAEQAGPPLSDVELSEKTAESAYFSKTLALALDLRPTRLISAGDFNTMTTAEGTIILDTRSAESYARAHLNGAVNLPLTEMTELTLALTLPSRTVPILIYSDQNFGVNAGPITHDSSDLSLNLLSFLALTQYGYTNVYELGERLTRADARLSWEAASLDTETLPISVQSVRSGHRSN